MPDDRDKTQRYRLWPINGRILVGMSAIGAIVLSILVCFAYVGGFLSPDRLTQTTMVDAFQTVNGIHSGFRRNHAKGVCVTGHFDSNGNGAQLSSAVVFAPGRVPVIGRFATATGDPTSPDTRSLVRSLALSFRPDNGEEWRTAMIDIPVFLVKDAQGFYDFLFAAHADPATGQPDPARMKAFFVAHPEALPAVQLIKARPFSTGFNDASYNALHAFRFVNAAGESTPVRWSVVAVDPYVPETTDQPVPSDKDYLFDALIARMKQGPVQWHLVLTVGQPGDPTDDPTLPWPADRRKVDVGVITLDRIETEAPHNCRDINYDPLVLPAGIEPSDDPLLSARSAAYSISYTRRAGEEKTPSEVQVPEANTPGKGA
jgi:Catalase